MAGGAGERNRTLDLLITSELLYQLSYTGMDASGAGPLARDCIVVKLRAAVFRAGYLTMVRCGRLGSSPSPSSPAGEAAASPVSADSGAGAAASACSGAS